MKSLVIISGCAGLAAGMAIAGMAITSMYPDVSRRMMRDGRRAFRGGKRIITRIGANIF